MRDLAISVKAVQGRLLVDLNRPEEAVVITTEALRETRPGAIPTHSVAFAHSLALAALQQRAEADHYLETAHSQVLELLSELSEDSRETAIAVVPAHRAVVNAWITRQPKRAQYNLARVGAPTGRALGPHERTSVTWTHHSPDDSTIPGDSCQRRHRLLRLLSEAAAQGGAPTIPELADGLAVSFATVRRDLALLRSQGLSPQTRGTREHGDTPR